MDPDGLTTDQLRRWAEAVSTVGLQQVVQSCQEELRLRARNDPHAWNGPGLLASPQGSSMASGNAAGAPSTSPVQASFPLPGPSVRVKCNLPCENPACHRRCKRSGGHRNHFCRPCHDAGLG